ncbi:MULTISPECIES: SDR family oxidoreductase [unclassified Spirosoma]|uniref:SDR family oxidoreductase n=1 Tax=unclassified Spirosoma TaxID=2621999 RepID=UPI00095988CC|nr:MULTISPECIES: SDR family oxidoreductase [unclassified Spirosoma]MBN8822202.1 SDR family oxidoreductase [Spirosoma sp.]OJW72479.1 MAG: short-chain dehydrogenase [Spirosoma sp. 48-14]
MNVENKTIIISGASRGIGRATALLLAQHGANVVVTARNANELAELEKQATEGHVRGKIVAVPGDVSNEDDMAAVVQTAIDQFQHIDVVINNAGYGVFKNVDELTATEWDELMATNVKGTFLLTKAALPHLKAQGSGHIVVVASDVAKRTFAGGSLYTASKYAQEAFTGALRKEVRSFGIKVTGVYSGLVDSNFHAKGHGHETSQSWLKNEDMAESMLFIVSRPAHVVVDEFMIHPLSQEY